MHLESRTTQDVGELCWVFEKGVGFLRAVCRGTDSVRKSSGRIRIDSNEIGRDGGAALCGRVDVVPDGGACVPGGRSDGRSVAALAGCEAEGVDGIFDRVRHVESIRLGNVPRSVGRGVAGARRVWIQRRVSRGENVSRLANHADL